MEETGFTKFAPICEWRFISVMYETTKWFTIGKIHFERTLQYIFPEYNEFLKILGIIHVRSLETEMFFSLLDKFNIVSILLCRRIS